MDRCIIETPLGAMLAAADSGALTGLWFEAQKHYPADWRDWTDAPNLPVFGATRAWLRAYFAGQDPGAPPALAPVGTPFQRRVWAALRAIPYGGTATYGELAAALGSAPRSVGGAVGRNPISIIVPCHRVLGADGALTGYAGGIARKRALLRMERGEQ